MALDLSKMQKKLAVLQGKAGSGKKNFFSPQEGKTHQIRIVPTADGDPFKEYWFHYELGQTFLCPKKNFNEACPACEFASKLFKEKNEESTKMAKKFLPRQRFFSPVLIRGEEKEGIKVWGYGKLAYEKLLQLTLNPDYGDITDIHEGTDLTLLSKKAAGQSFPTTDITPARKTSKMAGTPEEIKAFLDLIPELDKLGERRSAEEVAKIMNDYMSNGDSEPQSDESAEKVSKETRKYGTSQEKDPVEQAFRELVESP